MHAVPTSTARTARQQSLWLTWGRRLHHPATRCLLLGAAGLAGWVAFPALAPAVARLLPVVTPASGSTTTPRRLILRRHPAATVPTPVAVAEPPATSEPGPAPVWVTTSRTGAPPVRDPSLEVGSTPAFDLPCRVVRCGLAAGGTGEWAVEIVLEDGARDRTGSVLLPAGAPATGRVRLDRAGVPSAWPEPWRLWLAEDDRGGRDVDLTATFQPASGGSLAVGVAGRLVVRRIGRIGDHRDGEAGVRVAAAVAVARDELPVETLTGRGREEPPGGALPRP